MDGSTDQKDKNLISHVSDDAVSRSTKDGRHLVEEKALVIILVVLCLVIVVLGVVVAMGFVSKSDNAKIIDNGDGTYTFTTDDYSVEDAKILEDARLQANENFVYGETTADEIINFYDAYINDYVSKGETDRVSAYVWDRNDNLIAYGFEREALDVLLAMDLDILNEAEKYRQYANIVALARDLGLDDIASKYYSLLTASVSWGDRAIERFGANIEELK